MSILLTNAQILTIDTAMTVQPRGWIVIDNSAVTAIGDGPPPPLGTGVRRRANRRARRDGDGRWPMRDRQVLTLERKKLLRDAL